MKTVNLLVLLMMACLLLSCGDPGLKTPGTVSFTWNGTWASGQTFNARGTFTLDADCIGTDLSGTLVLYNDSFGESSHSPVSGNAYEEYNYQGDTIFFIDFGTADNSISFQGSSNGIGMEDLAGSPFITGNFTNAADTGGWHTTPGAMDCNIVSAVQTSPALSIRDLCSDGTSLYAVVNGLSSTAVYRIDPATGMATQIGSICAEPRGLAYNGGYFWIVAGNETDGFDLHKYDASWGVQAGYPKVITGAESDSAIGWHNGKIICPAFFYLNSLDPLTAVCSMGGGLSYRASYAEGDGTHLWVTYSAPGYDWSSFEELGSGSTVIRSVLTPDLAATPFTIQGDYLWTASLGGGLYKISIQ